MDYENIFVVIIGLTVAFAGRNVFWLVVGLVGFLFGVGLGEAWFADRPGWVITIGAIGLGGVGIVLAIVFERVAIALAGFYAAAYVALTAGRHLGYEPMPGFLPIVAGVAGALVTALLTDWAIIVLTALVGSAAVVSALDIAPGVGTIGFVVLALLGGLTQYAVLSRRRTLT